MDVTALLAQARTLGTLEAVLAWAFAPAQRFTLHGVTIQDEFTHDVVLAVAPAVWLVFETT